MKLTQWLRLCLLVGVSLLVSVPAFGQTTGEIRGTVKDPSGAVVQGATVTASEVSTSSVRATATGDDGSFDILDGIGIPGLNQDLPGIRR